MTKYRVLNIVNECKFKIFLESLDCNMNIGTSVWSVCVPATLTLSHAASRNRRYRASKAFSLVQV